MNKEQINKFLYEECEKFDENISLSDFKENICRYLMLCPWKYSEEDAKKTVSRYEEHIEKEYKAKATVGDVALDIGYCCG